MGPEYNIDFRNVRPSWLGEVLVGYQDMLGLSLRLSHIIYPTWPTIEPTRDQVRLEQSGWFGSKM